jgi:protein-serine/threonine kinase
MNQQPSTAGAAGGGPVNNNNNKGPDYVLFDRSLTGFSEDTIQKAKAAQLKLEHFYKAAVDLAIERNNRSV